MSDNIYTKAGDTGCTSLIHERNILKSDERLHLMGNIDELNSWIGVLKSLEEAQDSKDFFERIQINLMVIMAGIADPSNPQYKLTHSEVLNLEKAIDSLEEKKGVVDEEPGKDFSHLKKFVLPGKSYHTAQIDVVRAIVRRCERHLVSVSLHHPVDETAMSYFNRLSDYLYVLARYKESV